LSNHCKDTLDKPGYTYILSFFSAVVYSPS